MAGRYGIVVPMIAAPINPMDRVSNLVGISQAVQSMNATIQSLQEPTEIDHIDVFNQTTDEGNFYVNVVMYLRNSQIRTTHDQCMEKLCEKMIEINVL